MGRSPSVTQKKCHGTQKMSGETMANMDEPVKSLFCNNRLRNLTNFVF
uniref:Patched family protein n=1 Tax=Rhizophora mucronata TaxID=61149 RepID=A0A2P2MG94_RHIMU